MMSTNKLSLLMRYMLVIFDLHQSLFSKNLNINAFNVVLFVLTFHIYLFGKSMILSNSYLKS